MGNAESSFIVAMKTYRFYNAPSFCKVEKEEWFALCNKTAKKSLFVRQKSNMCENYAINLSGKPITS